jgi:opacity protein-like surface antigen
MVSAEGATKRTQVMKKAILLCGAAIASLVVLHGAANAADVRAVVVPPPVQPWYASIFGGWASPSTVVGQYFGSSTLDLQMDTGFIFGFALGYRVNPNIRSEIELSFVHHNVADGDFMYPGWCDGTGCTADGSVGATFLMGNTWFEHGGLFLGPGIRPYIGGGLGVAWVHPDLTLYDDSDYVWNQGRLAPAAQFGLGIIWQHAPGGIEWDLGYRAKAILNTTFTAADSCETACSAVDVQWAEHIFQIGANFHF